MDYKQLFFRVVFACWFAIITLLSLIESENFSRVNVKNLDKFIHFLFHFLLTVFLFLALPKHQYKVRSKILFSFLFSVIYGIIIELIQGMLTVNRQSELMDVLANICGSFLAFLVLSKWLPKIKFLN